MVPASNGSQSGARQVRGRSGTRPLREARRARGRGGPERARPGARLFSHQLSM